MELKSIIRAFQDNKQQVSGLKHKRRFSRIMAFALATLSAASFTGGRVNAQTTNQNPGEVHVICGIAPGQPDIVQLTYRTGNNNPSLRETYYFNKATGSITEQFYTDHNKWGLETGTFKDGIQTIVMDQGGGYGYGSDYHLSINKSGIRTQDDRALFDDAAQRVGIAAYDAANYCSAASMGSGREDIIPLVVQDPGNGIRMQEVIVQLSDTTGVWRFDIRRGQVRGISSQGWVVEGSGEIFKTSLLAPKGNFVQFNFHKPGETDTYFPIGGYLSQNTPGRSETSQTQPISPELQGVMNLTERAIASARPAFTFPKPNWMPSYTIVPPR